MLFTFFFSQKKDEILKYVTETAYPVSFTYIIYLNIIFFFFFFYITIYDNMYEIYRKYLILDNDA